MRMRREDAPTLRAVVYYAYCLPVCVFFLLLRLLSGFFLSFLRLLLLFARRSGSPDGWMVHSDVSLSLWV